MTIQFKEVYEKFQNGDSLSDEELKELIKFFKRLVSDLHQLGAEAKIMHDHYRHRLLTLEQYQQARRERW